MGYIDLTKKYTQKQEYQIKQQDFFVGEDGTKYAADGVHVRFKYTAHEEKVAKILGEIYGGTVCLIPVVLQPKGIKTPDYMINGEKFDLKEIRGAGKNTLDTAISKKSRQSSNFIFDISLSAMSESTAIEQISRIYNSKNRSWVNIIILIKNGHVIAVFKRI